VAPNLGIRPSRPDGFGSKLVVASRRGAWNTVRGIGMREMNVNDIVCVGRPEPIALLGTNIGRRARRTPLRFGGDRTRTGHAVGRGRPGSRFYRGGASWGRLPELDRGAPRPWLRPCATTAAFGTSRWDAARHRVSGAVPGCDAGLGLWPGVGACISKRLTAGARGAARGGGAGTRGTPGALGGGGRKPWGRTPA